MTAAASRLERRSEYSTALDRQPTGSRPQPRPAQRAGARPAQRAGARPAQRPVQRGTAPTTRGQRRPAPAARSARGARSAAPLTRRSDLRPQERPVEPLSSVVGANLFRARVESEQNIAQRRERHLRSIPRPRRFASILAPAIVVVLAAMLGIATFQTRMAQNQVEIDQLQRSIDRARATNQSLQRQRAELRSPLRLGREAQAMGMVQAGAVGFVQVDLETYADAIAVSGRLDRDESGRDDIGSTP